MDAVQAYYDSDDDVAWGPYTVREMKRDIMRVRSKADIGKRQSISCFPSFVEDINKRARSLITGTPEKGTEKKFFEFETMGAHRNFRQMKTSDIANDSIISPLLLENEQLTLVDSTVDTSNISVSHTPRLSMVLRSHKKKSPFSMVLRSNEKKKSIGNVIVLSSDDEYISDSLPNQSEDHDTSNSIVGIKREEGNCSEECYETNEEIIKIETIVIDSSSDSDSIVSEGILQDEKDIRDIIETIPTIKITSHNDSFYSLSSKSEYNDAAMLSSDKCGNNNTKNDGLNLHNTPKKNMVNTNPWEDIRKSAGMSHHGNKEYNCNNTSKESDLIDHIDDSNRDDSANIIIDNESDTTDTNCLDESENVQYNTDSSNIKDDIAKVPVTVEKGKNQVDNVKQNSSVNIFDNLPYEIEQNNVTLNNPIVNNTDNCDVHAANIMNKNQTQKASLKYSFTNVLHSSSPITTPKYSLNSKNDTLACDGDNSNVDLNFSENVLPDASDINIDLSCDVYNGSNNQVDNVEQNSSVNTFDNLPYEIEQNNVTLNNPIIIDTDNCDVHAANNIMNKNQTQKATLKYSFTNVLHSSSPITTPKYSLNSKNDTLACNGDNSNVDLNFSENVLPDASDTNIDFSCDVYKGSKFPLNTENCNNIQDRMKCSFDNMIPLNLPVKIKTFSLVSTDAGSTSTNLLKSKNVLRDTSNNDSGEVIDLSDLDLNYDSDNGDNCSLKMRCNFNNMFPLSPAINTEKSNTNVLCDSSIDTVKDEFNDTFDEVEKLLKGGYSTPDTSQLPLKNKNSHNVTKSSIKTGNKFNYDNIISPVAAYITSNPCKTDASDFKVPKKPIKQINSPNIGLSSLGTKQRFKNIKSPVATYIKNSPLVPLYKNITPQREKQSGLHVNVSTGKKSNKENCNDNFPEVVYKPAKKVVNTKENITTVPRYIDLMIPIKSNIIKHQERIGTIKKNSIARKLVEDDLTVDDSLLNTSTPDISVRVTKRTYIN